MVAASITPTADESQADFAMRFHEAMREAIPDTEERTQRCFAAWDQARGQADPLERRAASKFAPDKYRRVRHIPVFAEHTTRRKKDGKEEVVLYDRRALQAIADRCNRRILDTGDFAALTAGHTPTSEEREKGAPMPNTLGWSGPFRLGMIGQEIPRWAIFSDEWHQRQHEDELDHMRRRSPEVWLEERMEDRFLDPIAALGAETPRLDLGVANYARRPDGQLVERYSAVVVDVDRYTATFPAAGNAFVPGGTDKPQNHYEAGGSGSMDASPDTINQFVEAMMQTEPMQFVLSLMNQGPKSVADDPGTPPGAQTVAEPPLEAPAAAAPPVEAPPAAPPAGPPAGPPTGEEEEPERNAARYQCDDEDQETLGRYMAGEMDDQQLQQYMAGKRGRYQAETPPDSQEEEPMATTDQYSRQRDRVERARYAKIEAENKALKERQDAIEARLKEADQKAERAERYSKLNELRSAGVLIDPDTEVERTAKYSRDQFESHLDFLSTHVAVPMGITLPIDGIERPKARGDSAPKELVDKATRYAISQREQGNLKYTYEEALEHVRKEGSNGTVKTA